VVADPPGATAAKEASTSSFRLVKPPARK
jgi:hypothetical protein